jgi:hypothetical protein
MEAMIDDDFGTSSSRASSSRKREFRYSIDDDDDGSVQRRAAKVQRRGGDTRELNVQDAEHNKTGALLSKKRSSAQRDDENERDKHSATVVVVNNRNDRKQKQKQKDENDENNNHSDDDNRFALIEGEVKRTRTSSLGRLFFSAIGKVLCFAGAVALNCALAQDGGVALPRRVDVLAAFDSVHGSEIVLARPHCVRFKDGQMARIVRAKDARRPPPGKGASSSSSSSLLLLSSNGVDDHDERVYVAQMLLTPAPLRLSVATVAKPRWPNELFDSDIFYLVRHALIECKIVVHSSQSQLQSDHFVRYRYLRDRTLQYLLDDDKY